MDSVGLERYGGRDRGMWNIIDVIDKSERCNKYNSVFLVGLTEREILYRYEDGSDIELCYPGPTGFGLQRIGLDSVRLIRAIRECGRKKGEKDYIGVEYYSKSRDEMSNRELLISDIFSRFYLTEAKVRKAINSKTKKGRTVRLNLR